MNTAISLLRIALLATLSAVALAFIGGTEQTTGAAAALEFICFKSLGAGLLLAVAALWRRWSKTDRWFKAYNSFCNRV